MNQRSVRIERGFCSQVFDGCWILNCEEEHFADYFGVEDLWFCCYESLDFTVANEQQVTFLPAKVIKIA